MRVVWIFLSLFTWLPLQAQEPGKFPHRVHVAENYETDIERRWWLAGKVREGENGNRFCQGTLTRNFDRKMVDQTKRYTGVIFNPVPGPPMGSRTRLRFRYRIEGSDWLRCQIYSLTNGYHRFTMLENLAEGEWKTAVVDMTKARRPDGSGGALSADERIDDIQFYTDPEAELQIDDIVLYDAAEGETPDSFPEEIIFTGWFDTGKQGKEWPGDFEIVLHDKPRTWDAARSVLNPETNSPWIRVNLRGLRPAEGEVRVKFYYKLEGAGPLTVALANSTTGLSREQSLVETRTDSWAETELKFDMPEDSEIDEVQFRIPEGSELWIDDLLIYK